MATAVRTTTCDLCGLAAHAPLSAQLAGQSHVFCCQGCRQVYQILLESDQLGGDPTQTTLYQQCLQMGLIARPVSASESSPLGRNLRSHEVANKEVGSDTLDTTREVVFQIQGMWCAACGWLIEHAVGQIKGVAGCQVFFASDVARVTYKPARTAPEDIASAIRRLGYAAEAYQEGGAVPGDAATRARRMSLLRAVVAAIFAANAMMFSMALYVDYWQRIGADGVVLTRWAFANSLPVVWAGWPLFQKAARAARQGFATMETLITLGAGAAFFFSVWQMSRNNIHVYFDTADMLVALVLVGKYLESGAKGHATGAISLLYGLLPKKARVLAPDGGERLVALDKLGVGDILLIRPGERIPADGRILNGTALVDESLLTGESRPIAKQPGDLVTGATIATDAPLTLEVTQVGKDSALSQMISLVEAALAKKTPVERWADQISRRFVPTVIALALLTGAVLFLRHATLPAILVRMVAVLVIACPCALGLATPMAVTTGVGAAARRGILIANTAVLETLPRVSHLLLDKTGTLTEGRFAVRDWIAASQDDYAAVAALEDPSEHPLARAIAAYVCSDIPVPLEEGRAIADFARLDGLGITGTLSGAQWFIGNRALAAQQNAAVPDGLEFRAQAAETQGLTALFYGTEETVHGLITLGDALRPGAAEAAAHLRALGLTLEVISGDSPVTTHAVARAVGIETATAQMLPADKVNRVWASQNLPHPPVSGGTCDQREQGGGFLRRGGAIVAMAGDGINDAPALAQADIGIAFGSGTEIARRAADITLVGDDLGRLADLFTLARRTARVMKQNLVWACAYNVICIPLAIFGLVNPLVAAAAMLVSSLSVVLNTKRLSRQLTRE